MSEVKAVKKKFLTDDEWVAKWFEAECSPATMAQLTGISTRNIYERRNKLQISGKALPSVNRNMGLPASGWFYPPQIDTQLAGGSILIGSDAHVWPGEPSLIWRAFCEVAHKIKPAITVLNGDMIDGARISRHPRSPGWSPSIVEEIDAVRAWIAMLPQTGERYWTIGNHDERVDKHLVQHAPEMADFAGKLTDRFTDWSFAWSVVVNDDVLIRHRFRSGIHASWNNALHTGMSIVTGHTHQLGVKDVTNMRGTHYGIECGTLNDPMGAQFQYHEGAPSRAQAGFVVLTFDGEGRLLPPEVCTWRNGAAWFRGETWGVKPRVRVPAGRAMAS